MNRYIRFVSALLSGLFVFSALATSAANAQTHSVDVGATYTYLRTNLLPGCNCFGTSGGSGQVQFGLSRHISLLGDITVTHRGDVTANRYDLTQTIFATGVRYFPLVGHAGIQPFGDLLLGAARATGTLSPSSTGHGGSTAFAFQAGGGVQYPITHRCTLIPLQADYALTTFGNGAQNRQNDLRLSVGILFRLHQ